jgi:lycopene cyclase domain-containing protein
MPEYTVLAVLSVLGTLAVELFWLRTGVFRTAQYWISMAIVYTFHVLVDGWLTKLSAPIVIYDGEMITGVRVPWDIPVEDYLFGFSMITLTILVWLHLGDRDEPAGVGDTTAATTSGTGNSDTDGTNGTTPGATAPRSDRSDRSTEETV